MTREKGITLSQLAIAWVLAQGENLIVLVGSRTVAQMRDSLKAIDVNLTKNDLERMEQIIHNWEYWRTALPEVLRFVSKSFHR